jgi:hypothetical protein
MSLKIWPPLRGAFLLLIGFLPAVVQGISPEQISFIERGGSGEPHLVFLHDGTVRFVIEDIELPAMEQLKSTTLQPSIKNFRPSYLQSKEDVYSIFSDMRTDYRESGECYNMAHIWAKEAFERSRLNSMKLFIFFSSHFIRRHRFPWWFHVAPMVFLQQGRRAESYVLDRRYATYPMGIQEWSEMFVKTGRQCRLVRTFAEYRNQQAQEDCFLIETSMYFWQPRDIQTRDTRGIEKSSFIPGELGHALRDAFP